MTLEKALRLAGLMEPGHVVEEELLIEFLSELEGKIQVEIFLVAPEEVIVYTAQDKQKELLLRPPHDRVYVHYLAGMIRMINREFEDYNNQCALVDEKLREFRTWFKQTYRPTDTHCRDYIDQTPGTVGTAWRGYYLTAYGIAVKHGFQGTEAEWLGSLKGVKGDKGDPALMRYDPETGYIQWQSRGDEYWQDLIKVAEMIEEAAAAATERAEKAAEQSEDAAERAEKAAERAEDAAGRADGSIEGLASTEYVDAAIAKLREDINYKPITFTSISIRPAVVQLGQTVEDAVVSWALSKAPIKQTVGAVSVGIKEREYVIPGVYSKGVTVTATDERGATAMKSVAISFFNAVYYGKVSGWGMPTDAALQAMPHKLQDGRTLTIQADAGEMEHLIYACPSRMGTPEFWANGFMGGFERLGTIQHCNAAGYTEDYDVWISGSAGLSGVTVTVK